MGRHDVFYELLGSDILSGDDPPWEMRNGCGAERPHAMIWTLGRDVRLGMVLTPTRRKTCVTLGWRVFPFLSPPSRTSFSVYMQNITYIYVAVVCINRIPKVCPQENQKERKNGKGPALGCERVNLFLGCYDPTHPCPETTDVLLDFAQLPLHLDLFLRPAMHLDRVFVQLLPESQVGTDDWPFFAHKVNCSRPCQALLCDEVCADDGSASADAHDTVDLRPAIWVSSNSSDVVPFDGEGPHVPGLCFPGLSPMPLG